MLQESFKGISRKIERFFNGVLSRFQVCLKEVLRVFLRLRGVPRDLHE